MPSRFCTLWVSVAIILVFFTDFTYGKKTTKRKNSHRIPLIRTKKDLRDVNGVPMENLKGRPGQGYYIATNLGKPPQRVSITRHLSVFINYGDFSEWWYVLMGIDLRFLKFSINFPWRVCSILMPFCMLELWLLKMPILVLAPFSIQWSYMKKKVNYFILRNLNFRFRVNGNQFNFNLCSKSMI